MKAEEGYAVLSNTAGLLLLPLHGWKTVSSNNLMQLIVADIMSRYRIRPIELILHTYLVRGVRFMLNLYLCVYKFMNLWMQVPIYIGSKVAKYIDM